MNIADWENKLAQLAREFTQTESANGSRFYNSATASAFNALLYEIQQHPVLISQVLQHDSLVAKVRALEEEAMADRSTQRKALAAITDRATAAASYGEAWRPMSVFPPNFSGVLMWNVKKNAVHAENSYRIGHPIYENTCDCSPWMPLPPPPTDIPEE